MYLILYPQEAGMISGNRNEGVYHSVFTDDAHRVQQVIEKEQKAKVYRISDLTEICGMSLTYQEITRETK